MAASTAPALLAGAITLANDAAFAPIASGGTITSHFNWRILPATGAWALMLAGLEKIAPGFAVALAWLAVAAVVFTPLGAAASAPVTNITRVLGYQGGGR